MYSIYLFFLFLWGEEDFFFVFFCLLFSPPILFLHFTSPFDSFLLCHFLFLLVNFYFIFFSLQQICLPACQRGCLLALPYFRNGVRLEGTDDTDKMSDVFPPITLVSNCLPGVGGACFNQTDKAVFFSRRNRNRRSKASFSIHFLTFFLFGFFFFERRVYWRTCSDLIHTSGYIAISIFNSRKADVLQYDNSYMQIYKVSLCTKMRINPDWYSDVRDTHAHVH